MGHAGAAAGTSLGPRDSWGHCCTPPVGCRENAPPCLCSVGTQEWNEAQVARKGAPLPFRPQWVAPPTATAVWAILMEGLLEWLYLGTQQGPKLSKWARGQPPFSGWGHPPCAKQAKRRFPVAWGWEGVAYRVWGTQAPPSRMVTGDPPEQPLKRIFFSSF